MPIAVVLQGWGCLGWHPAPPGAIKESPPLRAYFVCTYAFLYDFLRFSPSIHYTALFPRHFLSSSCFLRDFFAAVLFCLISSPQHLSPWDGLPSPSFFTPIVFALNNRSRSWSFFSAAHPLARLTKIKTKHSQTLRLLTFSQLRSHNRDCIGRTSEVNW